MIARLVAWLRATHIRILNRKVDALGRQLLEAQQSRDWLKAAQLRADRDVAIAKRNALQERARAIEMRREAWLHTDGETCPPCNHNGYEGDCPRRT